jgi:hypothetical protein
VATWILSGWSAIWKLLLPNHHDGPETAFWEISPVKSDSRQVSGPDRRALAGRHSFGSSDVVDGEHLFLL